MALGEQATFEELHSLLEYVPPTVMSEYPGVGALNFVDVSLFHRIAALIELVNDDDAGGNSAVQVFILQAGNADGTDATILWASEIFDLETVEERVLVVDRHLGKLDSGNRYVAIGLHGASGATIAWLLLGSGPRYKPPCESVEGGFLRLAEDGYAVIPE